MGANTWPKSYAERIAFIQQRESAWADKATQIGLTESEVTDLIALLTPAATKHTAAVTARSTAKTATTEFHVAAASFSTMAGALIRKIRAFAEASGDPDVYALAQLDPVSPQTPAPAPEIPSGIVTSLLNDGSVQLTWKSRSPRGMGGVTYEIQRRLSSEETYKVQGSVTEKTYIDETLPPGTPWASYRIIARRAGKSSDFTPPFMVYLGVPTESAGEGGIGLAA